MSQPGVLKECEVILGNSNKRFSGITSTMLQTLFYQKNMMNVRVLGKHHLPPEDTGLALSFWQAAKLLRKPLPNGRHRVFHARRNDEMIQALLLKHIFGAKFRIVFTSTAQRHHTRFTRWLMSKMDCIISTCNAAASYLDTPPAAIIPHGIQTDVYFPAEDNQKKVTRPLRIAMFGRVRPQKGVHILIEACLNVFPTFPNCEAIIVGLIKGAEKDFVAELEEKIKSRGLEDRIRFLGEQDFDDIPPLFRSSDIVAALSFNEGFGLTVLEAMSSGAAVIASEAGAWPDIVQQDKCGYLVPVNNIDTVSDCLTKLLSSPEKTAAMGKAGRKHILDNYTIEKEAERLCTLYRSLQ